MKTHVQHGVDITSRAQWFNDALGVVGGHHEKFDGAGYPEGLTGEAIPRIARIFAISDVFDALTSKRPYKEPMPYDETMEILSRGRGSHFDPELLDAFTELAPEFYRRYAGDDGDGPRRELGGITHEYFKRDLATLLS